MTKDKESIKSDSDVVRPAATKISAQTPRDPKAMVFSGAPKPDPEELAPQVYLVKKRSFINGQLVEAGEKVQLPDGVEPGKELEPVGTASGNVTRKALAKAQDRVNIAQEPTTPASGRGQMERQFQQSGNRLNDLKQAEAFQEGPEGEKRYADERAEKYAEEQKNAVEPEDAASKKKASGAAGRRLASDERSKHEGSDNSDPI